MKKRESIILLISWMTNIAFAQNKTFESHIKELGIIKRSEYYIDLLIGTDKENGFLSNEELFDNNGYMISSTWYNIDGSMKRKQVFMYDDKGLKKEELWYSSLDTVVTYKLTFDYNATGQMIHCRHYIGLDKILWIYTQEFDADNNVSLKNQMKADSILFIRTAYQREPRKLTTTEYNKNDKIRRQFVDYYNEQGDIAQSELYDRAGELIFKEYYVYEYNEKDLMERVKVYDETKKQIGLSRIVYDFR